MRTNVTGIILSLFPTYVGVIPAGAAETVLQGPFPHIRGGDPEMFHTNYDTSSFSPHTWG